MLTEFIGFCGYFCTYVGYFLIPTQIIFIISIMENFKLDWTHVTDITTFNILITFSKLNDL